ncbi:ABC transporter substrate-binding protein [Streptomyces ambofaciens]|uniref:ABC transporter substrate-binding protein n=1 Tax=Streptomyces ambofaciens TaxID=1889 RepID=A0ABM6B171_STRAM|nr:extracellular solute-binding protein [Streptomyces ambofaciens]ANB07480.1 ABC transporter substrate-binding protein [Streptomyces ambofaciens]
MLRPRLAGAAGRRLAVLAAPLLLLLPTACGGGGGGGGGTGHAATPSADVPGDIVVASGRDVTGKNGIRQRLIDVWNTGQEKAGTGYRARLVELPGNADEQRSQLLGALQSGSAAYDVVNLDVTWVPEFAAARLISPLPKTLLDEDVIEPVARTARWDGEVYAAPFNSDVGLLYYRRDHLREAGVERPDLGGGLEWPELKKLITTLDERRPDGYEKGWTTQLAAYEGRTVNAVEAFASAVPGFTLTDEDGRYEATVEELTEGITELRRRTEAASVLPDAFRSDEAASLGDFAAGRTSFLRHWPYVYPALHQTFPKDRHGERLGVTALPGRAVLGGQNLAVTAASQRADKATELIRFLTGKESERCLLDAGFAATRVSAYTDDAVTCAVGAATPSAAPTGEGADTVPRDAAGRPEYAHDVLLPALQEAAHRPRTPLYGAFTQTFTTELGALFADDPPGDAELARRLAGALEHALPH